MIAWSRESVGERDQAINYLWSVTDEELGNATVSGSRRDAAAKVLIISSQIETAVVPLDLTPIHD
jgi:hypothetical protein